MGSWKGKIVAVTGGSVGLGLAIAEAFGLRGATAVLIARNAERLSDGCEALASRGVAADSVVADVVDARAAASAIDLVCRRHGGLDVLVNNVGRSIRVEMAQATAEQYRELMEVNFMSAVHCTQAALPHLAARSGYLVNIGSLSSRTAWPFLAPYTASKFALAGYTQQLRIEGPQNVHYMLACPGPIKREDSGSRYVEQNQQLPDRAQQPGAGARIRALSAAEVARRIVRGCERRKLEMVMPMRARILFAVANMSPRAGDWILRRLMQ